MTTAETNVPTFDWQFFSYVVYTIIGIFAAIVTIFLALKKFSLKIGNEFETSYIDAYSNEYIEFRKFRVKLGFTIRAIKLPKKFDKNSTVNLWYKPANGFRRTMKKDDYDEKPSKNDKKIQIKDKEFLKSKEIELFRSKMVKKLSTDEISEYTKGVSVNQINNTIRIENKNNEEIRNFSFNLPAIVTYDDASFYFDNENVQEIKASLHEDENPNGHLSEPIMKMSIKKIPATDGQENPGVLIIPLPETTLS